MHDSHVSHVCVSERLLFTPFRNLVVPPPMCAYSVELSSHIHALSFCNNENKLAVLLSDGKLEVIQMSADENITGESPFSFQLH